MIGAFLSRCLVLQPTLEIIALCLILQAAKHGILVRLGGIADISLDFKQLGKYAIHRGSFAAGVNA